jgi:uncharacterized repeat protein (TIGR03803 family)
MMKPFIAKIAVHRDEGSQCFCRRLALAGGCWLVALTAAAQSFDVLFTFPEVDSSPGGGNPASLMLGTNGNFYGTSVNLGAEGWGAIYQMTPSGAITPVYSFTNGSSYDGSNPYAGLAQGTNGLFYGMAQAGGSNGCGTIFEVESNGTFTSLYSFARLRATITGLLTNKDGSAPVSALVLGTNGNFYGTAEAGGTNSFGTLFEVTHQGKVTVLHSFSNTADGGTPLARLLQFTNGNLYGTAAGGGTNGYGTVFQVTAAGHVTPIYSFTNGVDGATPEGALINGEDGQLYGTCSAGGTNGTGTIFKITPAGVLTPLYSFSAGTNYPGTEGVENEYNADGINPKTILLGSDNNIYGVAYYGGANGAGSVFQFAKGGGLMVAHSFDDVSGSANSDGANPISLLQGPNGKFYGTAFEGGSNAFGTIFSIGLPPVITAQPTNQAVGLHGAARFSVAASNALGCQWQFNGGDLPNATNETLSITNVLPPNAGSYQAVVTNLNGATTSAVVILAITNLPVSFVAGALEYGGGQFSLLLTNLAGQGAVVIEASGDLRQWTPIYTNAAGFGTAQFIDTTAGSNAVRFYRAWTP